ncbi:MAG: hypothetical protein COB46_02385 [Rhodospirillaceae bacterium]|nr:MAG: hypothetical protein COB46_02385 [Rhodospirillaceae bacterium]
MTNSDKFKGSLHRRHFLQGLGAATILGVGGCAGKDLIVSPYSGQPLQQPLVETSEDGLLDTKVVSQMCRYTLDGDAVNLRGYNGKPVGNTLDIKGGDTLKLKLINDMPLLDPIDAVCTIDGVMLYTGYDVTNMHLHGLHVSPKAPSDDIFISVKPGHSYPYEYEIPKDHPPGTYFYHAHVHGSTAIQVGSGMSGALIIRGDIDDIPAIKAAKEQVMVMQTQRFDAKGECPDYATLNLGDKTYINGQYLPVIRMKKGEVQRWRLINASHKVPLNLKMEWYRYTTTMPFTVLCLDGNPLPKTREVNSLELVPGNRADVLVKGFSPGTYYLTGGVEGGNLATIIVEDEGEDMTLYSGDLPENPHLKPISAAEVTFGRRLEFGFVYGQSPSFTVNDKVFSCDDPWQIPLNSVEEWEVYNHTAYPHPFHIHVNPFQVVSGGGIEPGTWLDTMNFPAYERITFRTRFQKYTGKYVFHCHNLMHEDMGMMQGVEVTET